MSIFSASKSATPSSILKKTPSVRATLNETWKANTPKVRFVLPHSKKVRAILEDYKERSSVKEFENLVVLIRDSELLDSDISSLLKEATNCISLLTQEVRLFVEAILSINWLDRDRRVIRKYQSFIVNLLSAHIYHADLVIVKLVSLFLPNPALPEWENGKPTEEDLEKCDAVHSLLYELLKNIPLCKGLLVKAAVECFPYLNKSTHMHEYYIENLLQITYYEPTIRKDLFRLIFSKLIIMDVNAPREEIEKLQNEEEYMMTDDSKTNITVRLQDIPGVAHTLDVCMNKMFDYFYSTCHQADGSDLDWSKTKSLYQDILITFDEVILPTYNTHHVQFIMFILCSYKNTLTEAYLNYLWKKVSSPSVASVIRQSSINYIVSLLARATFVSMSMLKGTLQQIAEWIHSYIGAQDSVQYVNSDLRTHTVFYTVCQALFYIVAFRHKDLVNTKKNLAFLQSLNLGKIVTCDLNPLRVCQPSIVQYFAAITRNYQLAYCYTKIEQNSRNTLPTLYRDEKGFVTLSDNVLEAFYPFDDFLLERAGEKIQPYFRQFSDFHKETNEDVEMKDVVDFDDFLDCDMVSPIKVKCKK